MISCKKQLMNNLTVFRPQKVIIELHLKKFRSRTNQEVQVLTKLEVVQARAPTVINSSKMQSGRILKKILRQVNLQLINVQSVQIKIFIRVLDYYL